MAKKLTKSLSYKKRAQKIIPHLTGTFSSAAPSFVDGIYPVYAKSAKGPYFRLRDPSGYAKEIALQWEKYGKRGMRLAQVYDQVFSIVPKWVKAFSKTYREYCESERCRTTGQNQARFQIETSLAERLQPPAKTLRRVCSSDRFRSVFRPD